MWQLAQEVLPVPATPTDLLNWFFSLLMVLFILLTMLLLPSLLRGL